MLSIGAVAQGLERLPAPGKLFENELQALAAMPTMREWLARSEGWAPVEVGESPAAAVAAEREPSSLRAEISTWTT